MSFSRKYFPCLKCNSLIFENFKEVHEIDCHQFGYEKLSHPFIKAGFLTAQAIKIVDESEIQLIFNNSEEYCTEYKYSQRKVDVEPGWVRGLKDSIPNKFVYLNEVDMVLCNIASFSVVMLSKGNEAAAFLSIPSKNTPPCSVHIYECGFQNFGRKSDNSLVSVRQIDTVNIANEIILSANLTSLAVDPCLIENYIRRNCKIPNLLRKGDKIKVFERAELVVDKIIDKDHLKFDLNKNLLPKPIQKYKCSIQYLTSDDWKNGTLEASTIDCCLDDVTIGLENIDLDNTNHSATPTKQYVASTPVSLSCKKSIVTKRRRSKNKLKNTNSLAYDSKNISMLLDNSELKAINSSYFVLDDNTTINIICEKLPTFNVKANTKYYYYKDKQFLIIKNFIMRKLESYSKPKLSLCNLWTGICLTGHSGTGKTSLVNELSIELHLPLITISLLEWAQSNLSEKDYIYDSYKNAKKRAPSILFFDEIDSLCIQGSEGSEGFMSQIFKITNELKTLSDAVILICATNRPEKIPSKLIACGRFDKEIVLNLPKVEKKTSLLWYLISAHRTLVTKEEVYEISCLTRGYTVADLESLVRAAVHKSDQKRKIVGSIFDTPSLSFDDLKSSISSVIPSFLRQNYTAVAEVHWDEIFGYDSVKYKIMEILKPSSSDGSYTLKGLLLFGPPGCSKTMIVRAIATETRFTFFPVKCSDLLSKFVGETERALCSIFRRASMSSPSLVFMDEIDSLCSERSGHGGSEASVVTELLPLIKKAIEGGEILVVGATNRPLAVDEVLLSPDYLEACICVDLPDCPSRCSIWKGLLKGVPAMEIDILYLCEKTDGFSGAEITDIYQKTCQTLIDGCIGDPDVDEIYLWQHHLLATIESVRPRTSPSSLEAIKDFLSRRRR